MERVGFRISQRADSRYYVVPNPDMNEATRRYAARMCDRLNAGLAVLGRDEHWGSLRWFVQYAGVKTYFYTRLEAVRYRDAKDAESQ